MTREDILKNSLEVRELFVRDCYNVLPKDHAADLDFINHLASRVEEEYRSFLSIIWNEIRQDDERSLDDILDKRYNRLVLAQDYNSSIKDAHSEAKEITLWEQITNSNYRDIDHLNELFVVYVRDLMAQMTRDFLEDIE